MNAVRGARRIVEHRIEEAAVLYDRDAVSVRDVAPRQRGHGAEERGQVVLGWQEQIDPLPPHARPDEVGENERCQKDDDGGKRVEAHRQPLRSIAARSGQWSDGPRGMTRASRISQVGSVKM